MKKTYLTPSLRQFAVGHQALCVGSGTQGRIDDLSISTDAGDVISDGSDFGVKTTTVQWEGWE